MTPHKHIINPNEQFMRTLLLVAVPLICVSVITKAQVVGKTFPSMTAETVDDKEVILPESTDVLLNNTIDTQVRIIEQHFKQI